MPHETDWPFVLKHIGQFPHCDSKLLHPPGTCEYCDAHPEWQALRMAWGINFTREHDPEKAPCPGEKLRSVESAHAWHGNRPKTPAPKPEEPLKPRTAYEHILEKLDEEDD